MILFKMGILSRVGLFLLIFGMFIQAQSFAQGDTLITKYGDVLIGKIDRLDLESLKLKVRYRKDAIEIKIAELVQIKSSKQFLVNDVKNRDWKGSLVFDSLHRGQYGIQTSDTILFFKTKEVFGVSEIKKNKLTDHLNLGLDFGINRIKADNSISANLGVNAIYKTRRWVFQGDYSAFSSAVDSVSNYWRNGILAGTYVFPKEWFVTSKLNLYTSTEQSLDLRRNVFLGVGKIFIHRSDESLSLSGGVVTNREIYTTSSSVFSSSESFVSAHYNGKFSDRWESILDANLFPSLSETGRIRSNLGLDIKYKFLNHFYLGLRYTLNTDNQPQVEAAKTDYVFSVKFGWSLKKY
ncbi:DUF481 domain-containing protein [Algoriphagus litoralis]|uniref:DUF481 domain-containing protein n=1 Tax=Algoriphagus litoralis TaxID=2202829 RepID=UPI000DBA6305|nr:DUF481 domain-containing protein [Algoriphagus litoralis]